MDHYVYIIYNKKYDKFYIGQTYDLNKRVEEHNNRLSKYTAKYEGGWEIVHYEKYSSRADALKREGFLKKQKNKDFYRKISMRA